MLQHPKLPFFRIALGILSGILIEYKLALGLIYWITISGLSLACILLYQKMSTAFKWKHIYLSGTCIYLLLISTGAVSTIYDSIKNFPAIKTEEHEWIILQLTSEATQTQTGNRFKGAIYTIEKKQKQFAGNCFLYLKDDEFNSFHRNDLLLCTNKLNKIIPKKDPFVFDFYTYAHQQKIDYTLHMDKDQLLKIGEVNSMLDILTTRLRNHFLQTLRKHIQHPAICGLAEAMLTGYREDLDKDLLDAYTNTGVVHIIAISGLHLGLIFWLAGILLEKLIPTKWLPVTSLITVLPMLWIFSIMTGSSASVLRSVIMFSLSIAASTAGKKYSNLNALMASGVFLLLYNPSYIFDIGFQLSYAAVASILLFEKSIRKSLYLKNKFAIYVWSMISITLSAQILTTPFVIYHFHRFPVLFLFSNLIAVPLSSLILLLEIGLCFTDLTGVGASMNGKLIIFLTECMNSYVTAIETIPFNLIRNIYLNDRSFFLSIIILLLLLLFIFNSNKSNIFYILSTIFLCFTLLRGLQLIESPKKDWTIFQMKGKTCIIHRHGKNINVLFQCKGKEDLEDISRKLQTAINYLKPEAIAWKALPEKPYLLQLSCSEFSSRPFKVLSGLTVIGLKDIAGSINQDEIVIADGSNTLWKIKEWEKEAHELNLRFLSTSLTGSVTIDCQH